MEISKELKTLAKEFNKNGYTLYIVGGYVRDFLLGHISNDIDITSNMPYDKVIEICKSLKMKTIPVNKTLGTLHIQTSKEIFEYTQFRKESYSSKGIHTPNEISFVDDISIDCKRRDITINAIYYDIIAETFVDNLHGQEDLKKRLIRTCQSPDITLSDDGLRILRLIRFASYLNFKFEKKTYSSMKKNIGNLRTISKERILKELQSIVTCDIKLGNRNDIFLRTINKLKILPYIFNSSLTRVDKFSKSDINNFYNLSQDARLIGFYILVIKNYLKSYTSDNQLFFAINMILGRDGIKESKDNIKLTEKLYRIYQNLEFDKDSINATLNYLGLSDCEIEIINAYISKDTETALSANISYIKSKNLPISIHELDITAKDLIDNGISEKFISKILSTLFNQVIESKVRNQKDHLINLAKDIDKTFRDSLKNT